MTSHRTALATALAATMAMAIATPALAHGSHSASAPAAGTWQGGYPGQAYPGQAYPGMPYGQMPYSYPGYAQQQAAPDPEYQHMLERCRINVRDNHVGGALIGGAVGGLVGNRIAGGDRIVGTVAGAAVGAVAGAVIDKAEDKGRDRECEDFFRRNGPPSGYAGGYAANDAYPGYGYMMVPVMITTPGKPCVETTTVTEEWVDAPRRRYIPRRPVIHDKRVKEKRVYTGS
jgi:hypothetical protein